MQFLNPSQSIASLKLKTISLSLTDKQFDLLERIAKADDRRLSDLSYLLFGRGLAFFFCESSISIKKLDSEYTKEEIEQQAKNKELEKIESWDDLTWEQRKEKGFVSVDNWFHNHDSKKDFIQDLADSIEDLAIKS